MTRTRISQLILLGLSGFAGGWASDSLMLRFADNFLPIGWGSALCVGASTLVLGIWGWHIKPRLPKQTEDENGKPFLQRASNPLPALTAARTVAAAMAASRAGSLLLGLNLGFVILSFQESAIEISSRHGTISAATALLSLFLTIVGWWLERICTLPPTPPSAETAAA